MYEVFTVTFLIFLFLIDDYNHLCSFSNECSASLSSPHITHLFVIFTETTLSKCPVTY